MRPLSWVPGGLPRTAWLLIAGRVVNQLGAFSLPFLTVALTQLFGASIAAAGALMAVFGAATILSRLVGGWLADRVGPRFTIVTGLVATATAQLALAGSSSLVSAALSVAMLGLAFELYEPPSQALLAEVVPPERRPAAYGLMSASLAGAGVAAGLLAAAVGVIDLRLLFVIDAVTCVLCAVVLRVGLPAMPRVGERRGTTGRTSPDGETGPWRDPRLILLLVTGTVFAAVYLQLPVSLGLTLGERHLVPTDAGYLFALAALLAITCQPLLSRGPVARLDPFTAMALGYGMLGIGLLANGLASTMPQFAAAALLWAVGDLILLGRAHALVADIAPPRARARYFAVYGLSWGVAAVIGPAVGGQFLERFGPTGLWGACAATCGALAAAQPVLRRSLAVRYGVHNLSATAPDTDLWSPRRSG